MYASHGKEEPVAVCRQYLCYHRMRHPVAGSAKMDELAAVKTLQAVGCAHPDETSFILVNTAYIITGKPDAIFGADAVKGKASLCMTVMAAKQYQ